MFELFKPDFEAILLSVRDLPPVKAILKNQSTQGNKGQKGIRLVAVATKTRPCIELYKATGNPREMCD